MNSTIISACRRSIYHCNTKTFAIVFVLAFSVLGSGCGESKDTAPASKGVSEQQISKTQQPVLQLDPKAMAPESGFAFAYQAPQLASEADITGQANRSPYSLTEDGKPLTPTHSIHDDIRKNGKGSWSHWGQAIYFSSSDGTDPRQNNRKYVLLK